LYAPKTLIVLKNVKRLTDTMVGHALRKLQNLKVENADATEIQQGHPDFADPNESVIGIP
jgi:hypothetical protein